MKEKVIKLISLVIFILIVLVIIIYKNTGDSMFYLEKEYYSEKGLVYINNTELEKLVKSKKSFVVFVYNNFCSFEKPCDNVFEDSAKSNNIEILKIPFEEYKKTSLYKKYVKYAPSVIIIKKGQIVDYLDANKDEDAELYQNIDKFSSWIRDYIYLK